MSGMLDRDAAARAAQEQRKRQMAALGIEKRTIKDRLMVRIGIRIAKRITRKLVRSTNMSNTGTMPVKKPSSAATVEGFNSGLIATGVASVVGWIQVKNPQIGALIDPQIQLAISGVVTGLLTAALSWASKWLRKKLENSKSAA
jgi:hypothetical protein